MVSETNSQIFTNIPMTGLELVFKKWIRDVLKDIQPIKQQIIQEQDERLSRTQLAKYLQCTLPTVDRYRSRGIFPFYQTGRTIYFKRSEVDTALQVPGNKKGANKC